MSFEITYKGRKYRNAGDALRDQLEDAKVEGVVELTRDKIRPFESEIKSQGGTITIDFDKSLEGELRIEGISDELKRKIEATLS